MAARVFISCGQSTPTERQVAKKLERWFRSKGFDPYVAIQAQSLSDINAGIINVLRASDFYVFIDFRRERLGTSRSTLYRGSLFTNQELAIAYILNFENAIFLQQEGIELNGLLRYMGSNSERFKRPEEVPSLVRTLVNERHWDLRYTRHLEVGALQWSPPLLYSDHTGQRPLRVLYVDIHNRRPDVGALSAIARLQGIVHPDGRIQRDVDFSPLKATGKRAAYDHVVWPGTHVAWDSLGLHLEEPASVYLNSALDVARAPIISAVGKHVLGYEVFAENFAVLRFGIALVVREQAMDAEARIVASPFS